MTASRFKQRYSRPTSLKLVTEHGATAVSSWQMFRVVTGYDQSCARKTLDCFRLTVTSKNVLTDFSQTIKHELVSDTEDLHDNV